MVKSSFLTIGALAFCLAGAWINPSAMAQNCTSDCRSDQIQFTPGMPLTVDIINQASVVVNVQQKPMTPPVPLRPGRDTQMGFGWGTQPNLAIYVWANTDHPIRVRLHRPAEATLQIEIYDAPSAPIDGIVYVQNDGRVIVY